MRLDGFVRAGPSQDGLPHLLETFDDEVYLLRRHVGV
jgi:hypothetical protein